MCATIVVGLIVSIIFFVFKLIRYKQEKQGDMIKPGLESEQKPNVTHFPPPNQNELKKFEQNEVDCDNVDAQPLNKENQDGFSQDIRGFNHNHNNDYSNNEENNGSLTKKEEKNLNQSIKQQDESHELMLG
jgi:hypothetical protein